MAIRMLIDATHREETRVAVVGGTRLEDFDFETSNKKSLKGNIYLAKVSRVEPSLQAAFVEYGGNRHGFLAFNEIHPDYYQIPVGDRDDRAAEEALEPEDSGDGDDAEPAATEDGDEVEVLGGDELEEIDEMRTPRRRPARRYKIQEVIKKRQILLVQVTKEERGSKGAALSTYISLAGRYCVLMPNTSRGGGISRKVTNPKDRKRLKAIMDDLDPPTGIGIILRTAGVSRSKAEIRRDYDYLLRQWSDIREATLESTAPTLIYEEGNIVKRAIRDLYTNEIDEVIVDGEEGYRSAKDFMKMLIPSHAKRVKKYKEGDVPLFHRYQVEAQIENIHSPIVRLKSGGYIVIDSTEALVAIDVNSGRSTRERNIEETAYRTNLEAAEEIARQLRLRDLAGLIVIDFIDMEESRNNANVERRLKEAMRSDRARIQVGRISAFGLLELSRQRLRPSLIEATSETCPQCAGLGVIRSIESTALHILRHIEDEGIRQGGGAINVFVPEGIDTYILNRKRHSLNEIETRYGLSVLIFSDSNLVRPTVRIEPAAPSAEPAEKPASKTAAMPAEEEGEPQERGRGRSRSRRRRIKEEPVEEASVEAPVEAAEALAGEERPVGDGDEQEAKRPAKRRRRGRRGGRKRSRQPQVAEISLEPGVDESPEQAGVAAADAVTEREDRPEMETASAAETGEPQKKAPVRRRRSRVKAASAEETTDTEAAATSEPEIGAAADTEEKPKSRRRRSPSVRKPSTRTRRGSRDKAKEAAAPDETKPREEAEAPPAAPPGNGGSGSGAHGSEIPGQPSVAESPTETAAAVAAPDSDKKPKRGWWRTVLE